MIDQDRRLLPARGDIAAEKLRGQVEAKKFVSGVPMQVALSSGSLRREPDAHSEQIDQALFGETFTAYEIARGWAWGQLDYDGYVGWMALSVLNDRPTEPTHRVIALRTLVFERPETKAPVMMGLSMGARLTVRGQEGNFLKLAGSGWIFASHAAPVDSAMESDFVAVAQRFLGTPYLWGGRESTGLDCSGLVQVSLAATGLDVLRDSDMQAATVGSAVEPNADFSNLKRGDLVFWSGHVAIMLDERRIIHASGKSMSVEIEEFAAVRERFMPIAGPVKAVRRL